MRELMDLARWIALYRFAGEGGARSAQLSGRVRASGEVSHALTLPQPAASPSLSRCAGEGP